MCLSLSQCFDPFHFWSILVPFLWLVLYGKQSIILMLFMLNRHTYSSNIKYTESSLSLAPMLCIQIATRMLNCPSFTWVFIYELVQRCHVCVLGITYKHLDEKNEVQAGCPVHVLQILIVCCVIFSSIPLHMYFHLTRFVSFPFIAIFCIAK